MPNALPHFLLLAEAHSPANGCPGRWRFQLQAVDGGTPLTVTACEGGLDGPRLELLAVVRGLEALQQPSRVTLVTHSRYVAQGYRTHLTHWENNSWQWERFGRLEPIRDEDLWRRLARAARIHTVECCSWRFEPTLPPSPEVLPHRDETGQPLEPRSRQASCQPGRFEPGEADEPTYPIRTPVAPTAIGA